MYIIESEINMLLFDEIYLDIDVNELIREYEEDENR